MIDGSQTATIYFYRTMLCSLHSAITLMMSITLNGIFQ